MGIDQRHPEYSQREPDWVIMRDTFEGERQIKSKNFTYLSPTPGQLLDGMNSGEDGIVSYAAYKSRANFPDYVENAIRGMIGIMHHKPPTIELPEKLEPLRDNATVKGESLEQLLRRINSEQLLTGRVGLLADVASGLAVGALPYIATYSAKTIINWDDGENTELTRQKLNLVVLDESEEVRSGFEWERKQKYRVLALGELEENEETGLYSMGVFNEDEQFSEMALTAPSIGGQTLEEIPFVFINTTDITPDTDKPPLLALATLAASTYRLSADYRQNLFMQGQDTLVTVGNQLNTGGGPEAAEDDNTRVGAGAKISMAMGGTAMYIGVNSKGLSEQRTAIENEKKEASETGGKLLDTRGKESESGDALRIRVSARTASLNQIALTAAEGLQVLLRIMAVWVGANPEEVIVVPNLDFADDALDGQTLLNYMSAKELGAPISQKSIHELLQDKDLTEMSFEEELAQIAKEKPLIEPEPAPTVVNNTTTATKKPAND